MTANPDFDDPIQLWPQADLGVLRNNRREPPVLPVEVFGEFWGELITDAAAGASAPVDYTGCTLLACAATWLDTPAGCRRGRIGMSLLFYG